MSETIETWLQGGPFYELSFLIRNESNKRQLIDEIFSKIINNNTIELMVTGNELNIIKHHYIDGEVDPIENKLVYRVLDINSQILVAGKRKARLFIQEISEEFVIINFWFFGSIYDAPEWNQIGLKDEDKPEFKSFFHSMIQLLNPVLGTIAYEEDCSLLFDTNAAIPDPTYSTSNLSVELNKDAFEYIWFNSIEQ